MPVLFLKLLITISLFLVVILNPGPAVLRLEINLAEFVAKADANAAERDAEAGNLAKIRPGKIAFKYLVLPPGLNGAETKTRTLTELVLSAKPKQAEGRITSL